MRAFGPAVYHEPDNSFRASCTPCVFRIGNACTHVSPARPIPDPSNTPDWCEMKAGMLADAKAMAGGKDA